MKSSCALCHDLSLPAHEMCLAYSLYSPNLDCRGIATSPIAHCSFAEGSQSPFYTFSAFQNSLIPATPRPDSLQWGWNGRKQLSLRVLPPEPSFGSRLSLQKDGIPVGEGLRWWPAPAAGDTLTPCLSKFPEGFQSFGRSCRSILN